MKIFKEVDLGKESRFLAVAKKLLPSASRCFANPDGSLKDICNEWIARVF
jgi:hypothetical protein